MALRQTIARWRFRWFYLMARLGHATGRFNVGFMYANGQGVPRDDAEAVRWYRLAAEQGDAHAQCNLALMHVNGRGVEQDEAEAVQWYRYAADLENASAQSNLGVLYANGRGVPQDWVRAYMWSDLAAAQGYDLARDNRDRFATHMTEQQVRQAREMAQAWTPGEGYPRVDLPAGEVSRVG
ncbi:MAG: tetratricopeptide repeat protein [Ectothiorhodospira sp.]